MAHHVCGLYYTTSENNWNTQRHYLPQVKLDSHTVITPVCFTTHLKQTFRNPRDSTVDQVRYTFPLYDGVAVGGYTITFEDKTLKGVVKQKDVAIQTYQAAVDRGETAGLLESLPTGIFGVTLGNLPAKTDVLVQITYSGELKHDAAIDGLRYTLPTSIAPRYGSYPGEIVNVNAINSDGLSITVDLDMGKSAIRKAQSPSHPIAVSMGATSVGGDSTFEPSKASATLTLGTTELADDFVLQLLIDDISKPQAIIEQHPELPSRAIMATLVPKFTLEPHHPEIVFIADQSGSMSGAKNEALVASLKVFLKSLPLGVRFNICAFGNKFKILWEKSEAYNEANVNTALEFVSTFQASYGGTEILPPIEETFSRRLKDLPLEVMLLTDGEIWQEDQVFTYINAQVHGNHANARVFGLGIGSDVSHTLVEGVARAGNGFAQFVTQNEETDQKVIRMLKGALYPHTKDWTMEVHYGPDSNTTCGKVDDDGDDFEMVEKVKDCLVIDDTGSETPAQSNQAKALPASLFDTTADLDKSPQDTKIDRYAHLPAIETPKLLQAPSTIPPLFPFNRSTVYLVLGADSAKRDVKAVTLRGAAPQGPLELTIDVAASGMTGSTVHQLAAKKALQDLEEGRGWLQAATTPDGSLVKAKHESRFDEIVEREAVRLGEKYQVAGKWTSFVAVEERSGDGAEKKIVETIEDDALPAASATRGFAPRRQLASKAARMSVGQPAAAHLPFAPIDPGVMAHFQKEMAEAANMPLADEDDEDLGTQIASNAALTSASQAPSGGFACRMAAPRHRKVAQPPQESMPMAQQQIQMQQQSSDPSAPSSSNASLFGGASTPFGTMSGGAARVGFPAPQMPAFGAPSPMTMNVPFGQAGGSSLQSTGTGQQSNPFASSAMNKPTFPGKKAKKQRVRALADRDLDLAQGGEQAEEESDEDMGFALVDDDGGSAAMALPAPPAGATVQPGEVLHRIIDLQKFAGSWQWTGELLALLGKSVTFKANVFASKEVMATALVIAHLEIKMSDKKDVWEMVVMKARTWLGTQVPGNEVDQVVEMAAKEL